MAISRRDFLSSSLAGSASVALSMDAAAQNAQGEQPRRATKLPILVCSEYRYNWIDEGYKLLAGGADTHDAALQGIKGREDDRNYQNVGLGGRRKEEGAVELAGCCMHGRTRSTGSDGGGR